ncbi:MAG: right-handed parallel beta-helix repeat-containing protein, partial [Candidatus Binatia bacterium]
MTELCFTKPTTIVGAGAETTIIDGGLTNRLAYLDLDSEVEISGVTLQRGTVVGSFANGAAIWNDGTLTLRNAIVRANVAEASGGGIFSNGPLSVFASRFEANLGREGGALRVHGPSTFVDSHFTDNAGGVGGALFLYRSTIPGSAPVPVAITGCLVDGNQSGLGAISSTGANVVVTNTTISGNRGVQGATGLGAGIRVDSGTMALRNVTITDNEGVYGGGISILSGTVSLRNAILAGNRATAGGATDCLAPPESPLLSEGHNLLENPAGCSIAGDTTGNLIGQPALLGALAANGGPTLTHAPGPGSPALDAGSAAPPGSGGTACAATDQRGVLRPEGTRCDIGALEKPPALGLGGVEPSSGGNVGSVLLRAFGSGFEPGASVRLVRAGEADVVGSSAQVDFGNSTIAASLDLGGRTAGTWDVLVENPGGATATLAAGFTIEAGGGPDLWLDLSGRAFARTLRATTLVVELGNRGNVDAIGVPLTISFPSDVRVGVHGDVLVPPLQPAQVFEDWSLVPLHVSENTSTRIHVPLLVPVIPAKSTRSVRLSVVLLGSSDAAISAAMGTPYFQDGVDPAAVASRVDAALAIVERTAGLPIPGAIGATLHADATAYVTAQSEAIRADALGRGAEVLGAPPRLYSESQLQLDAAYFAAQQAGALLIAQSPEPQALGSRVRANLFATAQAFQHMLSALASGTADAA